MVLARQKQGGPSAWSSRSDGPLVVQARRLGYKVTVLPFPSAVARVGDSGAAGPAGRQINRLRMLRLLCAAAPAAASYVVGLRRLIADCKPDVIHTNSLKMHILGIRASKGLPVVWHVRDYGRIAATDGTSRLHSRSALCICCGKLGERRRRPAQSMRPRPAGVGSSQRHRPGTILALRTSPGT